MTQVYNIIITTLCSPYVYIYHALACPRLIDFGVIGIRGLLIIIMNVNTTQQQVL